MEELANLSDEELFELREILTQFINSLKNFD